LKTINDIIFNFDKIELYKLRIMDHKAVKSHLYKIAQKIITYDNIKNKDTFKLHNILSSCQEKNKNMTKSQCKNTKLIVPKNKIDNMLDILASDILNPFKEKWLFTDLFLTNYISFFRFVKRVNEEIFIEIR